MTDKQKQLGEAIRRIRRRKNMSQADVAARMDMEPAAYGRYEAGARKLILRQDVQELLVAALDITIEDLQVEAAAVAEGRDAWDFSPRAKTIISTSGVFSQGEQGFGFYEAEGGEDINLSELLDGPVRAMRVADETMWPYVEPGHFVIYHTKRVPRRYQGVVVKMRDGRMIVRFYIRSTPAQVELMHHEGLISDHARMYKEVSEFVNVSDIAGVYPIIMRGE